MSEKSILKPCPFCGSTENYYWLHPEKCYLRMRFTKPMDISEEQLLEARNIRPLEDKLESRVKLFEAMTDKLAEAVKLAYNDKLSPLSFHKVMAELKLVKDKRNEW